MMVNDPSHTAAQDIYQGTINRLAHTTTEVEDLFRELMTESPLPGSRALVDALHQYIASLGRGARGPETRLSAITYYDRVAALRSEASVLEALIRTASQLEEHVVRSVQQREELSAALGKAEDTLAKAQDFLEWVGKVEQLHYSG
jgi:hypothetical protein